MKIIVIKNLSSKFAILFKVEDLIQVKLSKYQDEYYLNFYVNYLDKVDCISIRNESYAVILDEFNKVTDFINNDELKLVLH